MLRLATAGENYNIISAGALNRLPADGNVGLLLMVHTVGHDPIRIKSVSGELTSADGRGIYSPARYARIAGKVLFPELFRALPDLRPVYFETLPAASGGYEVVSDGFSARYLPGRNVVIVTTRTTGRQAVLQVAEWHRLRVLLLALYLQIGLEREAHGEAGARNAGEMADDFLAGFGVVV